jgi:hypothetical protein
MKVRQVTVVYRTRTDWNHRVQPKAPAASFRCQVETLNSIGDLSLSFEKKPGIGCPSTDEWLRWVATPV